MNKISCFIFSLFLLSTLSCRQIEDGRARDYLGLLELPQGFEDPSFPEENLFTPERWALGKKLFFDPIMSRDQTVSCASCHKPELAFSDNSSVSFGVENRSGRRNAPSLANVAYHPYYTREGGVPTLEMQALVPIQEHDEFDFNILLIQERLYEIPEYVSMAQEAYGKLPDYQVITRALATFQRALLSGQSPYDEYINTQSTDALTPDQLRGMNLFFSDRLGCSNCHSGIHFTNYSLENNGLYEAYEDSGLYRLTNDSTDIGRFKVASLRNLSYTAPYMHDGSLSTLEEVILHYEVGVQSHPNLSDQITPFSLTQEERSDLLRFLESLDDDNFVSNPIFQAD